MSAPVAEHLPHEVVQLERQQSCVAFSSSARVFLNRLAFTWGQLGGEEVVLERRDEQRHRYLVLTTSYALKSCE